MDSPIEIARAMKVKDDFNLRGGLLVSNPIPSELAIDKEKVNKAIELALKQLDEQGIKGKDSTPFLLKTVCDLTNGESLESNISLILNNAKVGSEIAKEYAKLNK